MHFPVGGRTVDLTVSKPSEVSVRGEYESCENADDFLGTVNRDKAGAWSSSRSRHLVGARSDSTTIPHCRLRA